MDTKPLERFATSARHELINAVDAQATAVLTTGSVARSERAEVVKRLEAEIGRHGRQHVIDKVAYTWFNRIIALRFMDARGYTGAGVVSPAQGQAHGQPEILADAKRGNLDAEVVMNTRTSSAIIGLLDGTRRSTDPEGEAYAVLLTEYCRYWHKSMPFMFEREGDYTELLVPVNLLAADAILARAREVLTEEVCDDVEVIGWLYQFYISERKDEVFAGFKKNEKAGADEIPAATQLFTPDWIVRYLVENSLGRLWMLNRPSSRLVAQMEYYIAPVDGESDFLRISKPEDLTIIDPACGSGHMLTYAFDLLWAIYEEEGYAPSDIPGLILTHNLHGAEIDPRAGALAAFALTMKARAKQRTFFGRDVEPKICVIEPISFSDDEVGYFLTPGGDRAAESAFWNQFQDADMLGSLIRPDIDQTAQLVRHLGDLSDDGDILRGDTVERARRVATQARALSAKYSVVVANPPYMGSGNMGKHLSVLLGSEYPNSKSDLMTAFMERAQALVMPLGVWGMINLPSWMFLKSFEVMREELMLSATIESLVHLGRGIFGSDFGSVAFIMTKAEPSPRHRGVYRRLFEAHVDVRSVDTIRRLFLQPSVGRYETHQSGFLAIPGTPISYWLSDALRAAFVGTIERREEMVAKGISRDSLGDEVRVAQGTTTGQNARFLRYWWEIARNNACFDRGDDSLATSARWVAADKGGAFRRWYGNNDYVIDWLDDGRQIVESPSSTPRNLSTAFQRSLACSKITSGAVSFRSHERGFVFTDAAVSVTHEGAELAAIASFLNSSVAQEMLAVVAPTLNFEVGQIRSLPSPSYEEGRREAEDNVRQLTDTSRRDWDSFETSWDFERMPMLVHQDGDLMRSRVENLSAEWADLSNQQRRREARNNELVVDAFGLVDEIPTAVPLHRVSLARNVEFRYGPDKLSGEYKSAERADLVAELVSYAVGCIFGRYSLDEPGLILASQGMTLQDYLSKAASTDSTGGVSFMPDADNVIPFVDDGWFEDDIVERFRQFLRAAFGAERFEENLRFVEESLGVKKLRDYFITNIGKSKFYDDHVQRYKKRPIYWMFSSPKGSFNALIYMHRYTPSTVSTVLNEYLREYRAKLEVAFASAELAKEMKEADRLRRVLVELAEYEHDVLYPLATQQIAIDLDDGVKANYPKFYPALKKIAGLETAE